MISFTIWFYLCSSFFVLAPPLLDINHSQSLENLTSITSHLLNANSEILIKRRKMKTNRTINTNNHLNFDIDSYRSSWKFTDKHTIRVRFRLYESLLRSIVSTRFLIRHIHTGHIRTYDEPHEIINSTLTLYLHNIKHGRHVVCLLLYTSILMKNPKHIFCQDIIFNFHKYGHQDTDSDEHRNTFVFLLTQYAIVTGILCILQLIHAARKRRFLRTVYQKANALRNLMTEYHRRVYDNKSTTDLNNRTHALEYLIYNLNRSALNNFDRMYMQTRNNDDDDDDDEGINLINNSPTLSHHKKNEYQKHLKLPKQLHQYSTTPLLGHRRSITTTNDNPDLDEDNFLESDFDTRSYEEQSASFKSVSHILEANKPWLTRLTDTGSIKHTILTNESLQNTQIYNL